MKNTASWVDEKYGKLLAKHHINDLAGKTEGVDYTSRSIKEARKTDNYLFERKAISTGFGIKTTIIRGYFLDIINSGPRSGAAITYMEYTENGKCILYGKKPYRHSKHFLVMRMTYHAHSRLFERLRTNSKDEVIEVLSRMLKHIELPISNYEKDITIELPNVGRLEMTLEEEDKGYYINTWWVAKTFIAEKKK